ncbi:MAG TPA: hypothetical protein VGJ88_03670 [Thermoanaerobaculia bacterium]|jgi:CheY-like chemotaxis protein
MTRIGRGGIRGDSVPAVAITAYARPEDRRGCTTRGFQRHVAKPFDTAELVEVVSELARYL